MQSAPDLSTLPSGRSVQSTNPPGNHFPYATSPASGLSLARPATHEPEPQYVNPRVGSLSIPSTQLFSSSAPSQNFVNPPSFFDGLGDLNSLQDFYSSPVDPYSLPYLSGFDLEAPTHIDPSHLSNGTTSYSPYDLPPSSWNSFSNNPLTNGTISPALANPSSPTLPNYPHSLSYSSLDHVNSFLGPKSASSSDLAALGKVKPLSAPVSRKNSILGQEGSSATSTPTSKTTKTKIPIDGATRCINCNTNVRSRLFLVMAIAD